MPYRWDQRLRSGAGLYRDLETGRIVSQRVVRRILDETLESFDARLQALARDLETGAVSLSEFQVLFMEQIKRAHYAVAALERGGIDRLTAEDVAFVGERVLFNIERHEAFAREIARGSLSAAQIRNRVSMYAEAPRNTHAQMQVRTMRALGFDLARSVRHARDSCSASESRDGCLEQAARGWMIFDDFVPTGERTCLTRCKCHQEFRNSATGVTVTLDGTS